MRCATASGPRSRSATRRPSCASRSATAGRESPKPSWNACSSRSIAWTIRAIWQAGARAWACPSRATSRAGTAARSRCPTPLRVSSPSSRCRAKLRSVKLALVVGNKNYSSWSMRPWVLLRQAQIPFEEVQLKFADSDGGLHVAGIEKYSAARKVPVLMIDGEPVWDSLAICETVAEMFPEKHLWPETPETRRVARSACAEMHSGFQALRSKMPMNIRSRHPGKGLTPESKKDVDRVVTLWTECRERFGGSGSLLFGKFSVADAFFAPVVMRFQAYAVKVPRVAQEYCETVRALAAVKEWCEAARHETEFVAADEPYAQK